MSIVSTVYGGDQKTPYRTKIQLPFGWRLHKFHRADEDRAWHDHPNHFWTYPFTSYWEELLDPDTGERTLNLVEARRWHYRPAYYVHRLLGRDEPIYLDQGGWHACMGGKPHWTLVREILPEFRGWGFYVEQPDGGFVRIPWRKYIFDGVRS